MIVRLAREEDTPGFIELAAQVEHWFGPMAERARVPVGAGQEDPSGHRSCRRLRRRDWRCSAACSSLRGPRLTMCAGSSSPSRHAGRASGRALMADAMRRFVTGPGTVEVVTFGADHPGATASGARIFYERIGFIPGRGCGARP